MAQEPCYMKAVIRLATCSMVTSRKVGWQHRKELPGKRVTPFVICLQKDHIRMRALFIILSMLGLVALALGLVRPAIFNKWFKGNATRKKTSLTFGMTTAILFFLIAITASPNSPGQTSNQTQNPVQTTTQINKEPKTDQQILEDNLKNNVSEFRGVTEVNYKELKVQKSDSDRPAGTNMVTVSVQTGSFYNKNSLLRDTGKLSSQLIQTSFASNMSAYDVIIWYYGKIKDIYGKENNDVVLVYNIDKVTYGKINWPSFDQANLCDFLEHKAKPTAQTGDTGCISLAKID